MANVPTLVNINSYDMIYNPRHRYEEGGTHALVLHPNKIEKRKAYVNYVLHECCKKLSYLYV